MVLFLLVCRFFAPPGEKTTHGIENYWQAKVLNSQLFILNFELLFVPQVLQANLE